MEVKVCPQCLSQNITFTSTTGSGPRDKCKDCLFSGTMLLMEKEGADKLLEMYEIDENAEEIVRDKENGY